MENLKNNTRRDQRNEFCIQNDLLGLIDSVITEKKAIELFESFGIKCSMCIDPDVKDQFFELSGLSLSGWNDNDTNKMIFRITRF